MLCYKEGYPLLFECFIPFYISIMIYRGASSIICTPIMVHIISVLPKYLSSFMQMSDFVHPQCMGNEVLCCKERHPLLLSCFVTFLMSISVIARAPDSIYEPLMAYTIYFLSTITVKSSTVYQILGTLSARALGCSAARRDIHCCPNSL